MPRFLLLLLLTAASASAHPLIVRGSANATAPLIAATSKAEEKGIAWRFDSESNTSQAIYALGTAQADIAATTRPGTADERAAFSTKRIVETPYAVQLVAFVVSKDVWESGVRSLDKEQMRRIYEGDLTNWKD